MTLGVVKLMGPAAAPRTEKPARTNTTVSAPSPNAAFHENPSCRGNARRRISVHSPSRPRERRPGIRLCSIGHTGPGDPMVSSQSLAKSIVKGSLRPKPDEVVLISTYPHTIELAEATALECQKAGADPALWLDTDALFYGNFKNYSVESLHRVSGHCVGLLDYVNSYVWLNGPRNPAPMATVPREKFAAMFEGEKAHFDKMFA